MLRNNFKDCSWAVGHGGDDDHRPIVKATIELMPPTGARPISIEVDRDYRKDKNVENVYIITIKGPDPAKLPIILTLSPNDHTSKPFEAIDPTAENYGIKGPNGQGNPTVTLQENNNSITITGTLFENKVLSEARIYPLNDYIIYQYLNIPPKES
jgi:hypothetical protein